MDEQVQRDERPTDGSTVTREVDLPAGVDDVWEALTDVERMGAWFGAPVEWEVRPGGPVHVGTADDGTAPRRGEIDEVQPGRRLRFRWWPADRHGDAGVTTVTYELEPGESGTHLVITEAPITATAPSMRASGSEGPSVWDVRAVGLWVGCHAGLSCRT